MFGCLLAGSFDVFWVGWEGGGLRGNAIRFREVLLLVDIYLGEGDAVRAGELSRELFVGRGDGFAWSAPVGVDCCWVSWWLAGLFVGEVGWVGMGLQSATRIAEDERREVNCSLEEMLTRVDILWGLEGKEEE